MFATNRSAGDDYSVHKLLLGTHTSGSEQNHLMIAEVRLPLEDTEIDARKYDDETQGTSSICRDNSHDGWWIISIKC